MSRVACETCGLVHRLPDPPPGMIAECVRCGAELARGDDGGLVRTAAFALAALMFYLPANLYPILRLEWYGTHSESTAWNGAVTLFRQGQPVIGVIVFLASIAIPFLKLAGGATIPSGDPARSAVARAAGERIVEMVQDDVRPSAVLTDAAFGNAVRGLNAGLYQFVTPWFSG